MPDDDVTAELERLWAENAQLKRTAGRGVSLKVSEKGGVSVYGLERFPVTLYKEPMNQAARHGRRHPYFHSEQRGKPQEEELTHPQMPARWIYGDAPLRP